MKKILLAIAALFCTTLSFAQEFMVVEHVNGVYNAIDVDYIKQGYFKTYEASGLGTAEDPFNIAAANAKCKETGETPTAQDYYIKGVIVSTPRNTSGTTFFYIADDISGINRLYAYQVLLYGNYELQRGDEVVLFCSLYNYSNYSPEATGVIVSINGQAIETPKPQGAGTLEDPYNVMAALEYIKGLGADVQSDKDIYVKGYITTIREQFSAQYGNAQFTMSDSKEGSNTLTFYRGLYLGNRKWVEGDATLAEGDEVIICGKVVNYKGTTPETVQNKAYIYSLNGKTDDTPIETAGTLAKPFTPAEANAFIATLPADTNTDKDYYIKGKLVKYANKGEFGIQYGNASFYISEDGSESSELFYVFRTLYLGNVKYNDESWVTPAVGDEVVICGKLVNYKGTTPETVANNSYIYSLNANNNGSGGGDSPSSDAKVVTIADFNAAAVSTDKWYQLTGTIKNLKDSDPYGNFDLEDSTGSVYVYGLLSEKGGEKKKFQDLVAAKGISNGKKITIVGTRGEYNGKIEVLNAYFVSIEDGGGSDTPTPSGATGTGTKDDPFNIAAAIAKCQEIGETASTEKYYIKGIVVTGGTVSGGYGNVTFKMGDTKDATDLFTAYQVAGSDGEKLADGYEVKAGDEVIVYGPICNYKGNTPETSGKSAAQIVTTNGKKTNDTSGGESGGGSTTGADGSTIISVADFNAAAVSTDVWYQLTGTIKNLKDGDLYGNFDLEDSTGSVYVYGVLSEKGGEKKKFQDLVAAKGIANGKTITIVGTRGEYNGKIEVMNAYFIKVE